MRNLILAFSFAWIGAWAWADKNANFVMGENLLTGEKVRVSAEGKKALVVTFLSARCPCSNSHIGELKELAKTYSDFSFVAIHSNVDEPKSESKPYFEKAALPFPVIEDQAAELADQFRALKTPHAFVISQTGDRLYQGGVSSSMTFLKAEKKVLREALDDLQNSRAVRTPQARALGCAIARGGSHGF